MRARRLRRARRNRLVASKNPKLGIEPSRSSQPRWLMKYARYGFERARFMAKSMRKMTHTALS
jgi:hypothetical protein